MEGKRENRYYKLTREQIYDRIADARANDLAGLSLITISIAAGVTMYIEPEFYQNFTWLNVHWILQLKSVLSNYSLEELQGSSIYISNSYQFVRAMHTLLTAVSATIGGVLTANGANKLDELDQALEIKDYLKKKQKIKTL